ncbi:MAG TPA: PEGA domain-containing protein [Vicinamibacterales bacterium]|nr:PEGA domain-containing protein [Vicinamibacterales bacterium]
MDPAQVAARALDAPDFVDGLGERTQLTDSGSGETVEVLRLRSSLTSVPSFEFALRERTARLANFRQNAFARVRRVDRTPTGLAVVSDQVPGFRLSQMLRIAEERGLAVDINAALSLIHQLLPAIALLHENARDVAHGALGPDRLIVTPHARLVVADYVLGSALEQLQLSHDRLWRDYRIPMPPSAGAPRFDHRADVMQIGVTSLSLILGRLLRDDECARIHELLAESSETSAGGARQPLSQGLRGWLARALQVDQRRPFLGAHEAQLALDQTLGADPRYVASPIAVEAFISRCVDSIIEVQAEPDAAAASPGTPAAAAPAPATRESQPVTREPGTAAPHHAVPPPPAREIPSMAAPERPAVIQTPAAPAASVAPAAREVPAAPSAARELPAAPPAAREVHAAPSTAREVITVPPPPRETPPAASVTSAARHAAPPPRQPAARPPATAHDVDLESLQAAFAASTQPFADESEEPVATRLELGMPARGHNPWLRTLAVLVVLAAIAGAAVVGWRWYYQSRAATPAVEQGTLDVQSAPPGVAVVVDGELRGETPLKLTLKAGPHIVELRGRGVPRVIPITMTAGANMSQFVEFAEAAAPSSGQLDVRSDPPGARVTIDGRVVGTAPMVVPNLAPGEHHVSLEREGASVQHRVTIEPGATATLVAPVAAATGPASGWISVSAPFAMQIFEEGRLVGSTETQSIMVPAGRHVFEIVNHTLGYRVNRVVQVQPGRTAIVGIELPNGIVNLNATPWAEVWIDDRRVGETPIGNLSLPIGPHEIVFRHPQFGEKRQAISVTPATPLRVSVDMRK